VKSKSLTDEDLISETGVIASIKQFKINNMRKLNQLVDRIATAPFNNRNLVIFTAFIVATLLLANHFSTPSNKLF